MNYFDLAENLAFGGQPNREDMEALAKKGIKTVVNLRLADEGEAELPPEAEAAAARELGMNFAHIPVGAETMNDALAGKIHETLAEARKEGPVFVH